jgi:CubicO group peptidase (beta-lactamase class C family)
MAGKKSSLVIALLFLLFPLCLSAQLKSTLPRSVPEAEGVSSEGIISFLGAVDKSNLGLHSFMFLRHGKVIAEGWWNPYRRDLKHTMYSLSKSFTSTAIGLAVSENRLTVNDKVISFFPGYPPDTISQYLGELTVQNLLTMSVGQTPDPTGTIVTRDSNWIRSFLALPILNKPGSVFLYNSLATYMLSAIVQKVTGQKVIDYLTPRLFNPLGIDGMDWETDPMGINTGGWGLRIKAEDMAKFGQLYLQKGKWNGKQLLPESWVEEATSIKILQSPRGFTIKKGFE